MKKYILLPAAFFFSLLSFSQKDSTVSKKDRKKDVSMQTSMGRDLNRPLVDVKVIEAKLVKRKRKL